jgi:uncharacterized repeat protein (TIGR01451 family)
MCKKPTRVTRALLQARHSQNERQVGTRLHSVHKALGAVAACILCTCRGPASTATPTTLVGPTSTHGPTAIASLQFAKLVDALEAAPGVELRYHLVVMNDMFGGGDPGINVRLTDELPFGLELLPDSLSAGASYDLSTRSVQWLGTVPRGGSAEVSFRAAVTAAATDTLANKATVIDGLGRTLQATATTLIVRPARTATAAPTAIPTVTTLPTAAPAATDTSHAREFIVPYVKSLVVTPDEPPVYFMVVGDSLHRSMDRGQSWQAEGLQGVPESARVSFAAIDYRHPQTAYLGTDQGLYRRESFGDAWRLVNTLVTSALAVDLENSDVLWAGTAWTTATRAVIMKSSDRGRTWAKADYGIELGYPSAWVGAILIDPNNPEVMWAHVRPGTRGDWPRGVVYRGGRAGNWEQLLLGERFDYTGGGPGSTSQDVCFVSGLAYDPRLNALYAGCDISWYNTVRPAYRVLCSLNADTADSTQVHWDLLAEFGAQGALALNGVRPLAVDAREPKSLFVMLDTTAETGVPRFRLTVSHDDGKSWAPMDLTGVPGGM